MKEKLYLLIALICVLTSCQKSKSAKSILDDTPATIYSMSKKEESKRMKGVIGCYGLTLNKTTPNEARKILMNQNADFKGPYHLIPYQVYKSNTDIRLEMDLIQNISSYRSEIKNSNDKSTYIHTIYVNDTLSQICVNIIDFSYSLEEDLVYKYGEGNGQKKDMQFGLDENGKPDINDYIMGYEYRQWQNDDIVIDWHEDLYMHKLSNALIKWCPAYEYDKNVVMYTSKKMAPRILYYVKDAYKKYIEKEEIAKKTRVSNL